MKGGPQTATLCIPGTDNAQKRSKLEARRFPIFPELKGVGGGGRGSGGGGGVTPLPKKKISTPPPCISYAKVPN